MTVCSHMNQKERNEECTGCCYWKSSDSAQHIQGPGPTRRNNRRKNVASSRARQSDVLRRLPSSGNRSRKISDSIIHIFSRIQSHLLLHDSFPFFAHLIIHHEVLDQQFIRKFWIMHLLGFFTCVLRRAKLLLHFRICPSPFFFSFFIFSSLIPSLCTVMMLATSSSLSLTPLTFLAGRI